MDGATALATDQALVLRDDKDHVATLTLNRPAARNALSLQMMDELERAIEQVAKDPDVRVVVLAANGPAFCAGHDLRELRADPTRQMFETVFAQCTRIMTGLVRMPKPVIARVHAMATAAGCQIAASCDLVVAAQSAKFATPGVNIGLFCSTPMVALSRAVSPKHAMEMLLTGDPIDAETARGYGLVNRVAEDDALDEATMALARKLAGKSSYTLAIGKEAFYRQAEMPLDDAYRYASEVMVTNMMARDAEEGIDAFLDKREPKWQGR